MNLCTHPCTKQGPPLPGNRAQHGLGQHFFSIDCFLNGRMFSTLEASTPSRLLLQLLWQGLSAPAVVAPAPVSQPVPAISRPAPELQAPFMPSVLTSWSVQPRRSCTCTLILSDPDSGICPCIYNFIIIVPCSCTDVYAPVIHFIIYINFMIIRVQSNIIHLHITYVQHNWNPMSLIYIHIYVHEHKYIFEIKQPFSGTLNFFLLF